MPIHRRVFRASEWPQYEASRCTRRSLALNNAGTNRRPVLPPALHLFRSTDPLSMYYCPSLSPAWSDLTISRMSGSSNCSRFMRDFYTDGTNISSPRKAAMLKVSVFRFILPALRTTSKSYSCKRRFHLAILELWSGAFVRHLSG